MERKERKRVHEKAGEGDRGSSVKSRDVIALDLTSLSAWKWTRGDEPLCNQQVQTGGADKHTHLLPMGSTLGLLPLPHMHDGTPNPTRPSSTHSPPPPQNYPVVLSTINASSSQMAVREGLSVV
jgi:hypothetical protein